MAQRVILNSFLAPHGGTRKSTSTKSSELYVQLWHTCATLQMQSMCVCVYVACMDICAPSAYSGRLQEGILPFGIGVADDYGSLCGC